jgi:hypothetical protein
MKYYLAIKKNEITYFVVKCIEMDIIRLREISQIQEVCYHTVG